MTDDGFGGYFRSLRRQAGLSQEDLAEASGSSVRTIRELERGRVRNPHQRTIGLMADALHLSEADRRRFVSLSKLNRFIGIDPSIAGRLGRDSGKAPAEDRPSPGHGPRQLPATPADLVGREPELSAITRLTGGPVAATHRRSLVVLHGPPGIGTSHVAVAAAHRIGTRFPDGHLFADLRGSATGGPVPAADVLAELLRSLAVDDAAIPPPGAAREGLFRTLLHDRRMLLVLDDAYDEAQVRPLLPGGAHTVVLVSSRRPLSGLDGAERIRLGVLPPDAARQMVAAAAGPRRVAADPSALDELVAVCGRWPLALRVAGHRLADRPAWSIRDLLDRLRDQRRRLGLLRAGDLDLRAAFTTSYRQFDPVTAAIFRGAAAIPGADFPAALAAAVAGVDDEAATSSCEDLVDAGLLYGTGDRYSFPELVRLFASQCLDHDGPDRSVARERATRWLINRSRPDAAERRRSAAHPGRLQRSPSRSAG